MFEHKNCTDSFVQRVGSKRISAYFHGEVQFLVKLLAKVDGVCITKALDNQNLAKITIKKQVRPPCRSLC